MIEAYKVGVALVTESNLPGVLGKLADQFEAIDRIIKRVQVSVNELAAGMRGLGRIGNSAADAWKRAADAMERAARAAQTASRQGFGPGGGGSAPSGGPARAAAASAILLSPGGGGGALLLSPPGGGGGSGGFTFPGGVVPYGQGPGGYVPPIPLVNPYGKPWPKPKSSREYARTAMEMAVPAYAGYEGLKSIAEPTMEADSIIALMRASRFSEEQITQATGQARGLVKSAPGTSYSDALNLILQTASFTGDPGEAMQLTPGLARNARILSLLGKGDAIGQVEAGIKSGELTGLTDPSGAINIPKLTDFVTRLTQTALASGGTLDIGKYLTGIRQFGVGADTATTDFTTAVLPAYMKIMSEAKAGTALASMAQSLLSERPNTQNKSVRLEQQRIGMRDASGKLVDEDALHTDPNKYIIGTLLPLLVKAGFSSPGDIQGELYKILPRQTMARLVAAGIFDAAVIAKEADRNRAQQKAGDAPLDKLLQESPQNQFAAFIANFKLLEITAGDAVMKPAMEALKGLTGVLNDMAAWAKKNPDQVKHALEGVAFGVAALGGGAALNAAMALVTGPARLVLLAAGIEAFGGSLTKIPSWLLDMAAGATVGARFGAGGAAVGALLGYTVGDLTRHGIDAKGRRQAPDYPLPATLANPLFGLIKELFGLRPKGTAEDPLHLGGKVQVEGTVNMGNVDAIGRAAGNSVVRQATRPQDGATGGSARDSSAYPLLNYGGGF